MSKPAAGMERVEKRNRGEDLRTAIVARDFGRINEAEL